MKIDIHAHTKKCKSGDALTREITPVDFCEKLSSTEVKIIAITNHNVFDLKQYEEIEDGLSQEVQVWPGIELDVLEDGSRGHLLVIVSPTRAKHFSDVVCELTNDFTPDSFTATVDQILEAFDSLKPLYVAHYEQKKPNISEEALEKLVSKTNNPSCVLKEVTNSISAGIYISHGHASIYGSDVHDWAEYERLSSVLPDLRLSVDSFEQFCLLLDKDKTAINTVLDRKTSEELVLIPFKDSSALKIKVFNDINVVFGPKGTGKTCILKAIAKHYSDSGIDASVYESASDRLDELYDVRGKDLTIDLNKYKINYCTDEITSLRSAVELDVTSLSKYVKHFAAVATNRNAKKLFIQVVEPEEENGVEREFAESNKAVETTAEFLKFLAEDSSVKKELDENELSEVSRILKELLHRLSDRQWNNFSGWKKVRLLNAAILTFRREVEKKTGTPAKPISTGFRDYAMNRVRIGFWADRIISNVHSEIPILAELVGSLGLDKGDLEFRTEFTFQSGTISDSALLSLAKIRKGTQKKFINQVQKIRTHCYTDELFPSIAELNAIEDVEDVKTVHELLLFRRYFALDDKPYLPSSGEASMVMLQKELGTEKDVYILDEPERSLGNEYINDVIVPLINDLARASKRVFISTHDANIAVRTLPYSSVYRCHDQAGYSTYVGNPFLNNLVHAQNENEQLDWKKISMKTLEGGEEAFGERGKIYGNN